MRSDITRSATWFPIRFCLQGPWHSHRNCRLFNVCIYYNRALHPLKIIEGRRERMVLLTSIKWHHENFRAPNNVPRFPRLPHETADRKMMRFFPSHLHSEIAAFWQKEAPFLSLGPRKQYRRRKLPILSPSKSLHCPLNLWQCVKLVDANSFPQALPLDLLSLLLLESLALLPAKPVSRGRCLLSASQKP